MKKKNTSALLREVSRLHLQLQRNYVLRCADVSSTSCFILSELGRSGPITLADLGRRLALDKGWISRAVESLSQDGLLIKKPSTTDRRTVIISLSAVGKERFEKLDEILNAQSKHIIDRIPAMKRSNVKDVLELLLSALLAETANQSRASVDQRCS